MATPAEIQITINKAVSDARAKAQSGLTLSTAGELFTSFTTMLVEQARKLLNDGPDKKRFVLDELAKFYDRLAPSIKLPWWLDMFRPLVISQLRAWLLAVADGAIEAIYARLKVPA